MNTFYRIVLAALCLFLAIACYVFGIPFGGVVFFLLGISLESLFWFGVFGKNKK